MAALARLTCVETCPGEVFHFGDANGNGRLKNDYSRATLVKSVCLNFSTVCGIQGYVIDGQLVKVGGNPEDPNNGKSLCAKGQSGPEINTYADRLLYPLERVGPRGSGQWRRITWDETLDRVAGRIRKTIAEGHPEETAIHIGRSRIAEEMTRFLNAIGTPSLFNHRALCSSNKRAANYVSLGDTDWETPDAEHTKYILNFGANFYEAHQGAIHVAKPKRVIKGRFDNGAKLVTFDVRPNRLSLLLFIAVTPYAAPEPIRQCRQLHAGDIDGIDPPVAGAGTAQTASSGPSPGASCAHLRQPLAEVSHQRVAQHFLDRAIGLVCLVILAASRRLPQNLPVGGAVAGAAKALRIDEGLHEVERVRVHALPLGRQRSGHAPQDVRGQMRHPHPGQDQEPRVVGQQPYVRQPRLLL